MPYLILSLIYISVIVFLFIGIGIYQYIEYDGYNPKADEFNILIVLTITWPLTFPVIISVSLIILTIVFLNEIVYKFYLLGILNKINKHLNPIKLGVKLCEEFQNRKKKTEIKRENDLKTHPLNWK